ncbi:subtilisin-like protease SBT1.2 [Brachypodium distachyon]|uniref:Subtilisin-like protease n=1 Tax=Brachypodium distachyon TaxID=15368 RepID=I1IJU1_BRADI|nr:subtilisin-like protease SBT1.2 [Brachypodium distachyon]KQJ87525.1 hypothetical protein BRADI_4g11640v3 [Brachypodium distachyon]|eukprot:XP_003575756.1 subtilisin-like protease SBT1.2 [Brachypodium distachyon]
MSSCTHLFLLLPLLLLTITFLSPATALSSINPGGGHHPNATQSSTSSYQTYILLVNPPPSIDTASENEHGLWHESFLPSSLTGSGEPRLVHSYTEVFSGFAVRLTNSELSLVSKKPGFVRAFPDRIFQPMTTHTPKFLGLNKDMGFWRGVGYGKGTIIGVLDAGIYAAHPSFDDTGIPPPPAKWKGSCQGSGARCNNKLIGAKFFAGNDSGDDIGHGTHIASTAAGNFVSGVSARGLGMGTAAGIAAGAHVAMYKVCTIVGCATSALLAGLDAAIKDGVDVISLSLAPFKSLRFDEDPISIGAFSAVSKGIVVVGAAGNNGPKGFLANDAPWILTVGAGSVDRSFRVLMQLGNGYQINGEAFTQVSNSSSKTFPLYMDEQHNCKSFSQGSVTGKIVICHDTGSITKSDIRGIISAGAAGVVLINNEDAGFTTLLQDYGSGLVQVTVADGNIIKKYVLSGSKAAASFVYKNTLLGIRPSPTVASFSSRGPSKYCPGVLKPDILAPGLNIIAAWPPVTNFGTGPFNIRSGTSMSTPHISGVAALVKSSHPDWSAAAIKSATLTTSDATDSNDGPILDEQHQRANAYATGAGHVNPARAIDPGLVYDLGVTEYAGYICTLLGDHALATIVRNSSLTCKDLTKVPEAQLNYPTITVPLKPTPFTVNRTVTNVGPANSTYELKLDVPESLKVRVLPNTLVFSKAGERKSFSVTVSGGGVEGQKFVEGSLRWVSANHIVRSPIVAVAGLGST